ncbi:MAG TPA: hypothetical protein VKA04_11625 [Pseudodesulfovibrio sp.]|nr:hypothetical protein [Pseudodesulfovibrio sp.]
MKHTLLTVAGALGLSALSMAQAAQHVYVPIPINPLPSFKYVDVDENGAVVRDEANHAHVLYGNEFIAADKDGNGWLSKQEYDQAIEKVRSMQTKRRHRSG